MKNIKLVIGLLQGYYYPSLTYARKEYLVFPHLQASLNAVRLTWWCLGDNWDIPWMRHPMHRI